LFNKCFPIRFEGDPPLFPPPVPLRRTSLPSPSPPEPCTLSSRKLFEPPLSGWLFSFLPRQDRQVLLLFSCSVFGSKISFVPMLVPSLPFSPLSFFQFYFSLTPSSFLIPPARPRNGSRAFSSFARSIWTTGFLLAIPTLDFFLPGRWAPNPIYEDGRTLLPSPSSRRSAPP